LIFAQGRRLVVRLGALGFFGLRRVHPRRVHQPVEGGPAPARDTQRKMTDLARKVLRRL